MKTKLLFLILISSFKLFAQNTFSDFTQIYPLGDDPNIRYMSSYTPQETILFEANPVMRYSLYNDFIKGLDKESQKHTQGWYIAFKPQFRMYNDRSKPVKMPSYRVLLGTQHLFRIHCKKEKELTQRFWGFSLESGHYSNGQNGSSFSDKFIDETKQGDSIYGTITPQTNLSAILNRNSGNFSTNLTELDLNYRKYKTDNNNVPVRMCSITLGYILYHNLFLGIGDFGGYTVNDIRIYGRNRYKAEYEFMNVLQHFKSIRYSAKQTFEYIDRPHPSVNRVRAETILSVYPFKKSKAFGFFASYIHGHDNYNYRFVDSGNQFSVGITWSQFPPVQLSDKIPGLD